MESSFETSVGAVGTSVAAATDSAGVGVGSAGEMTQGFETGVEEVAVFESVAETEGVFTGDTPLVESEVPDKSRQIMDIPGTAHEKLSVLAGTEDTVKELGNISESTRLKIPAEDTAFDRDELNPTRLNSAELANMDQAKTLETITKFLLGEREELDEREVEELIKKLEALLEELKESRGRKLTKKEMLAIGALSAASFVFDLSEKGFKEVGEASKN